MAEVRNAGDNAVQVFVVFSSGDFTSPRQDPRSDSTASPATPGGGCRHFWTDYYRITIVDGRCQIRELCVACGKNVRGGGINVPFAEAVRRTGRPVAQLPEWPGPHTQQNGGSL
jgi:hypothetical protein